MMHSSAKRYIASALVSILLWPQEIHAQDIVLIEAKTGQMSDIPSIEAIPTLAPKILTQDIASTRANTVQTSHMPAIEAIPTLGLGKNSATGFSPDAENQQIRPQIVEEAAPVTEISITPAPGIAQNQATLSLLSSEFSQNQKSARNDASDGARTASNLNALYSGRSREVAVLVSLLPGWKDSIPTWWFQQTMKRRFPEHKIKNVTASSPEDLKGKLKNLLHPNEIIDHLVLYGHGFSKETKENAQLEMTVGEHKLVLQVSKDGRLLDDLNTETNDAFSALKGRFSRGTKVIFNQCSLMQGDPLVVRAKALALQKMLGLNEGLVYANKTLGWGLKPTKPYMVFLWTAWASMMAFGIIELLFMQSTTGIAAMVPMAGMFANLMSSREANRGYLFSFKNNAVTVEEEKRDHFWTFFFDSHASIPKN